MSTQINRPSLRRYRSLLLALTLAFLIFQPETDAQTKIEYRGLNNNLVAVFKTHRQEVVQQIDHILAEHKLNFRPTALKVVYESDSRSLFFQYELTFHSGEKYVDDYSSEAFAIKGIKFLEPELYRELSIVSMRYLLKIQEDGNYSLSDIPYQSDFFILKSNGDYVGFSVSSQFNISDIVVSTSNKGRPQTATVKIAWSTFIPGFPLGTENEVDKISGTVKNSIVLLKRFFRTK